MKFKIKLFARNIVNPEVITDFIVNVSKGQSDKIKVWCNTILKNYLKNEYDNLKEVTKAKKTDPVWLQEAVKRKDVQKIVIEKDFERLLIEHIFHYFDTLQGNNIKHSFSEAKKQTKEWENKENLFNIKLTKGVKEILKCEGGYTWFEIIDEETLYNEGEILQNCMREKEHGKYYWKQIKKKAIKIFTLRDSKGIGHVGVEYDIKSNFVAQMVGKQNDPPVELYTPYCIELIKYLKCDVNYKITKVLNILIENNTIYDIFNLPDNLTLKKPLDLNETSVTKLPDNLTVEGFVDLSKTNIIKLPNNLKITADLYLNSTKITKLPNDLKIGRHLSLIRSEITKLPNNLKINGTLYLSYSKIMKLPNNLNVTNLNLDHTAITELPNTLKIEETLNLSYSKIMKLPNNLEVTHLNLEGTNITKLPNIKCKGNLNLCESKIIELPDNLKILGWLDLFNTNIMKLPENLQVKKSLYIGNTKISELPITLKVGEDICIGKNMKLINVPKHLLKKIKIVM